MMTFCTEMKVRWKLAAIKGRLKLTSHGRVGQMQKSISQDESNEDVDGMQQKAGELDRYARMQLMQENILEAFAMYEKSRLFSYKTFNTISNFLV